MPKFLLGNVVVRTYEVWAADIDDAKDAVIKWQTSETEDVEGGVKTIRYKLGWEESQESSPVAARDKVLEAFLDLMQTTIPGMPKQQEPSRIIRPFENPTPNHTTHCQGCGSTFPTDKVQNGKCPVCYVIV